MKVAQRHNTLNAKKNMKNVSLTHGYWFYFEVNGIEIAAHGSAYSGKETIYVNDNPVSEQRNLFNVSTTHTFKHSGKQYQVTFQVSNVFTGKVECNLFEEGQLQATQNKAFIDQTPKGLGSVLLILGLFFMGGFAMSFFTRYLSNTFW